MEYKVNDLLNDALVVLYFQPDAQLRRANAELVVRGMQEVVVVGERVLSCNGVGDWKEEKATVEVSGYHPGCIRLPDKYQTPLVRVTCPDCHLTYEHHHVFLEGSK